MTNIFGTTPIKITTFNLFNYIEPPNAFYEFDNIYTVKEWQQKQDWISRRILEIETDMIAFQEVFSVDALKDQLSTLGFPYFACLDLPHIENEYQYSSPVLAFASKFEIVQAALVPPSKNLIDHSYIEPSFSFSRQPLQVTVNLPEFGETDIYIVHFKSQRPTLTTDEIMPDHDGIGTWLSTVQRGFEANSLYDSIKQTKQKYHRACIVMGDFNQNIDNNEFDCFTKGKSQRTNLTSEAAVTLSDGWDSYCQTLDSANLAWSRQATHYYGSVGNVLDYILLSEEFSLTAEVTGYDVYDTHLINPTFELDQFSTDHAIVSLSIELK